MIQPQRIQHEGQRRRYEPQEGEQNGRCRRGCDVVILACTELSVARRRHGAPAACLDAMDVLVRESILRAGGLYRAD